MSPIILTEGSWQRRGLVLVWVPRPPSPARDPRSCLCGTALLTGRYCSERCRRQARRATWRRSKQKARQAVTA